MKTVILKQPEIKVTSKSYKETRDKLIDNIILNLNNHETELDVILGTKSLCNYLQKQKFTETTAKLVYGLAGFIHWCANNLKDGGWALTNIIHDLGEFKRNGNEDWFSPRTSSYSKYL